MKFKLVIFIIGSSVFSTSDAFCPKPSWPVIVTNNGAVRGRTVRTANNRCVKEFLNIPYAQPPVGSLRFRAPQPVYSWPGERDGTQLGNACVQSNAELGELFKNSPFKLDAHLDTISEDCLTINVFVPYDTTSASPKNVCELNKCESSLLPVIIWLHGGGFQWGANNLPVYNGSILATEADAIVVTVNYRLGALGFFTLSGVDGVSGNQGLLDQALAIKWVSDNAVHFGGDSKQITLMGQSAGAASVQYHTFSSMSRDLFARSIMQSGTAASFWAFHTPEQARKASHAFAAAAGCAEEENDEKLFECFSTKTVDEIVAADMKIQQESKMPLVPTVDGVFLRKSPEEHLRTGDFKRAPVLIGSTKNESTWSLSVYSPAEILYKLPDVRLTEEQFVSKLVALMPSYSNATRDAVNRFYRDGTVSADDSDAMGAERWRVLKLVADDLFQNNGMYETLDAYAAAKVPVYRYVFGQVSKVFMFEYTYYGDVVHCDDVPFFFGHPLDPAFGYPEEEADLSRKIMQSIGRFAQTGSPNFHLPDEHFVEVVAATWPPSDERMEYFTLEVSTYGKLNVGPDRRRYEFWKNEVSHLMNSKTQLNAV